MKILHQAKEAGLGASLTFTTSGGKMKAKLEVELDHSVPVPADPTPAPVKRRRQRGAGARARRNLRAAAHQASLAEAATSVPLDPPSRPLHILPSPPPASGRRQVMSVGRLEMPSFSSLNLDGDPPVPPPSPPTNPWIPCLDNCNIPEDHCEECYRCNELCIEHHGCDCYPTLEDDEFKYHYCTQCKHDCKSLSKSQFSLLQSSSVVFFNARC